MTNFDPEVIRKIKEAIEKAVEQTAIKVQEKARDIVPKDTQNLMYSIQVEKVGEFEARVTANTAYALAVHEGRVTSRGKFIAGVPYLAKPLQEEKDNLEKRIKDNL